MNDLPELLNLTPAAPRRERHRTPQSRLAAPDGADGGDFNAPALRHMVGGRRRRTPEGRSCRRYTRGAANERSIDVPGVQFLLHAVQARACPRYSDKLGGSPHCERSYPAMGHSSWWASSFSSCRVARPVLSWAPLQQRPPPWPRDDGDGTAAARRRTQQEIVELRSRRESFAESSPHELADAHVAQSRTGLEIARRGPRGQGRSAVLAGLLAGTRRFL